MPDSVQLVYDRVLSDGLPGSRAGINPTFDNCFIADGDIPYGVVISNASNAIKPTIGSIGKVNVTATSGYGVGTGTVGTLAALQAITTGGFKIYVDGTQIAVGSLDFSAATDLAGVAAAIQVAVRAVTSSTETVTYTSGAFKFTSATTGSSSIIEAMTAPATGVDVTALLGWTTYSAVAGIDAVTATVMGVVIRNVVDQASSSASNTPVVHDGDVGAYRQDGAIKVLAQEDIAAGSTVYFNTTTGLLYGSTGSGRTALGSSVWLDAVASGKVGIIDVRGLR